MPDRVFEIAHGPRAALAVRVLERDALVLGAFQRAASAIATEAIFPRVRRASGGPLVRIAPDTVHVALALPTPSALVAADVPRLVNRYVRPLLQGLTKVGATASFPGRDAVHAKVGAGRAAIGWVGFGHHAASGRSLFEAFVGVRTIVEPPDAYVGYPERTIAHPNFATVVAARGSDVAPALVADAIRSAYVAAFGALDALTSDLLVADGDDRPPWDAIAEDVVGFVGASREPFEVGGDFFAAEDAVAKLARDGLVDAFIDHGALEGLRDPQVISRVIARARQRRD